MRAMLLQSKVNPKPIKLTLKPIQDLFQPEFGLPKRVQNQYGNIATAAEMQLDKAPAPSPISPAAPDDMNPGRCSLSAPAGAARPVPSSFCYLLMWLSLSAIAALANIHV